LETIRELLRYAIERRSGARAAPSHGKAATTTNFDRWLAPTGALLNTLALVLYVGGVVVPI